MRAAGTLVLTGLTGLGIVTGAVLVLAALHALAAGVLG